MAEIDSQLRRALRAAPGEQVDLIIRLEETPPDLLTALESRGVVVRRRFRLSKSVSVRCSGEAALALASEPWVKRIESDQPMRALDGGRSSR